MISLNIKEAAESDLADVLRVEREAFGPGEGAAIASLVEELLVDPTASPSLSLLAVEDGQPVGHILFTYARVDTPLPKITISILAPLAVIPKAQNRGVGSALVQDGLKRLSGSGVDLVFVLGHPGYYPRHGFTPAGVFGLEAPYPVPAEHAEAWMVQALRPGVLGRVSGSVQCADALNRPEHWCE